MTGVNRICKQKVSQSVVIFEHLLLIRDPERNFRIFHRNCTEPARMRLAFQGDFPTSAE